MYDTSADMNWLPTRKKDNEYEELLSRRTNCSSRNNKKLQEQKKCEVRQQQHELHKTRNANYGSQSEVAWFAITCTWLSALVPSSYTRRELRVLRPVSTFTSSLEKLSRRTAGHHHEEMSEKLKTQRFMEIDETVPFELFSDFESWKTKLTLLYSSTYHFF